MMTIGIRDLTFECILGILDFERETPQRVIVDVQIGYRFHPDAFLDYAEAVRLIRSVMTNGKFGLVEEALEAVSGSLETAFPMIETLTITITKPDILPDCRISVTKDSED